MPDGTIDVFGGMAPESVYTSDNPFSAEVDPSYYELVVGAYGALTTFLFVDTTPDGKTVSYELYADTPGNGSGTITETSGLLPGAGLVSWSIADNVGGSFTYLLTAGSEYILKISTDGASLSETQISAVPLPGAALLFGSALLGAGYLRRRKQSGMAAA